MRRREVLKLFSAAALSGVVPYGLARADGDELYDIGKFDDAFKHAQDAEALANASIAQAKEQEKLWPEAVIR